ncbi:MAG: penicillin-binding protein 2 [Paracoccaceae bacterium]|nr:penicillin-binding protein 2 [Paracoccaceae bacterium]
MRRTPKDVEQNARTVSRRGIIFGGLQLLMFGTLGWRMRQLQLRDSEQFRLLADENRINIRLLPPARGLIFDRNGKALAINEQNYRVVIVREDAGDVEKVLSQLQMLINLSDEDVAAALKTVKQRSPFVPITVADHLTWDDVAKIAVNAPALPGITPEVGFSRVYPRGKDFAHVIGYVGPVSDYDLAKIDDQDPLLQIPKFQIGKTGVENKKERDLRGKAGTKSIEVNAVGRVMRELERQEGQSGDDLQLTIDASLQNYAEARLAGQSASCVVMDVKSGDLIAIGSAPSFDPNKFVRGISVPDYQGLLDDEFRPLASKSVQGTYPPGSTVKMVTALAALEGDFADAADTVRCNGYTEVADRNFHCWKRGGHGKVDLVSSLVESCDVYYYEMAQKVGIENISAMAKRLGLGSKFSLPLSAVASGLAPTKEWKRKRYGKDWVIGDSLNAAIGQGFVKSSPLQLAVMTARIATGTDIMPRLVKTINGRETPAPKPESLGIATSSLKAVRDGMFGVSNLTRGTGFRSRIIAKGMRMAGKTGTSQVRNISAAERASGVIRNEDLPWKRRDHALFVGYAPADDPKYAISVVVEHGGGGSTAAAPIARDIMLQALYGELPPLDAYPANQRSTIRRQQREINILASTRKAGAKDST